MNWKFWKKEKSKPEARYRIMPWTECVCPGCGKIVNAFEPCDCDEMDDDTLEKAFLALLKDGE